MMCTEYGRFRRGCRNCNPCLRTDSIIVEDDLLEIKIQQPLKDLDNGQRITICLAQPIPAEVTANMTTLIEIEGIGKFFLITNRGNYVYADQLRCKNVYHLILATDTPALVVPVNELCRTDFVFPVAALLNAKKKVSDVLKMANKEE